MTFIEQFPTVFVALNQGFLQTLKLFCVTLLGALPLGLVISFGSMSKFKPLSAFVKIIVWLFRGSPLMIQLLIVYYFPGLILGNNWWGSGEEGRFIAASVAFILNYACYFSEIYRAGIEGVPLGQQEAGQVLGLSKTQIFFKIKLPLIFPSFISAALTSLGFAWKSGIAAEVIAKPLNSLGSMLEQSKTHLEISEVFALTAVVAILSLILEVALKKLFGRYNHVKN